MRNFIPCIICLALLVFSQAAPCQSPDSSARPRRYHVNYVTGSIIMGIGLGTDAFAISRIKDKPNLTTAELQALNPGVLNSFDRWALHQDPSGYHNYSKISDEIEPPLFILLPTLLALDKRIPKKEWMDILFMYFEGHTITFTFYNYSWLGPTFQNRIRPLSYYSQLPLADRLSGGNRNSFYSGHTASVAFTTFFIVKVYCDYHPDLGFGKYLLYTAALIPPVAMGYFRVRALAHFPSDDLVGLSLGAVIGIVIPALHKANYKGVAFNLFSTPDATGLSLCWTLPDHKH